MGPKPEQQQQSEEKETDLLNKTLECKIKRYDTMQYNSIRIGANK